MLLVTIYVASSRQEPLRAALEASTETFFGVGRADQVEQPLLFLKSCRCADLGRGRPTWPTMTYYLPLAPVPWPMDRLLDKTTDRANRTTGCTRLID